MEEEFVIELKCLNGEMARKLEEVFADAVDYQMFGIEKIIHFNDSPQTIEGVKEKLDQAAQAGIITPAERQNITAVCRRVRELHV